MALQAHLRLGLPASQRLARKLGHHAIEAGFKLLDLAKLHEQTLVLVLLPGCPAKKRTSLIRQAGIFFAIAVSSIRKSDPGTKEAAAFLEKSIEALSRRTVELADSNQKLSREVSQRKKAEEAFKNSERQQAKSLKESNVLKEQLRRLSRLVISAQEDERKKISRELHDVIAQALMGINIHLATLKKEASLNTKGLTRNITMTQRLVNKSASIVHEFARELRPPVLDDLGLIPALHTYLKNFTDRTGVHARLTAFAGVKEFNVTKRTMLFRVAQEALSNIARHAKASRVEVSIRDHRSFARMEIHDNGRSFQVDRVLLEKGGKRLGLIGMRERAEMVGGTFCIESEPARGTTVRIDVPFTKMRISLLKKSGKATLRCV